MRHLILILAFMASPLAAQTQAERLEKARTEINTVENAADRAVYACERANYPKCAAEAKTAANAASRALYAVDQAIAGLGEPEPTPTPTPEPTPPPVQTGYVEGPLPDTPAPFDPKLGLKPTWGDGSVPGIYSAEEGAFRFTCGGAQALKKDDPLVYPNQPGKAHWHLPWGNKKFDASITTATLLMNGASDCNDTQYVHNRSSYWMPSVINDQGQAIHPDLISVYYKRFKSSSPQCTKGSSKFMGICVALPNGIGFIFGWDQNNPDGGMPGASWYCTGGTGQHVKNLDDLFNKTGCKAGDTLIANTIAPNCWDGKYLDTPDHRSHMAYGSYGDWGYLKCPETHPYVIPQEENKAQFTVTADMIGTRADGSKYSRISLSSDMMKPNAKPGETLHADYLEAWLSEAKAMWHDNCIEKGLNCSGGDLGNGLQLIGADKPAYGWKNPNPREQL